MTIDEFIRALRSTPRTWGLVNAVLSDRRLLRDAEEDCPIIAVGRRWGVDMSTINEAASNLGLKMTDMQLVMRAADGVTDPEFRSRLMEACGLAE